MKLLLHCEDGLFPYMSPYLLKKYFPSPCEGLVLGVAVKDSCVVPVYREVSNKKVKHKKLNPRQHSSNNKDENHIESNYDDSYKGPDESTKNGDNEERPIKRICINSDDKENKTTDENNDNNKNRNVDDGGNCRKKPAGYTFERTSMVDYLGANKYESIIVPTFDLVDDAMASSASDQVLSTNAHVQLVTYNGMNKITPDLHMYVSLGFSLTSNESSKKNAATTSILPLFDQPHLIRSKNNNNKKKRINTSIQRTLSWFQQSVQYIGKQQKEQSLTCSSPIVTDTKTKVQLWLPILTDDNIDIPTCYDMFLKQMTIMNKSSSEVSLAGISLLGWHRISSISHQESTLKKFQEKIMANHYETIGELAVSPPKLAIMNTANLYQIFLAAKYGVSYIGTSIPSELAKKKLAISLQPLISKWKEQQQLISSATLTANDFDNDNNKNDDNEENIIMNMADTKYMEDSRPLVEGCTSMCCQNHSRAYIHHLVRAKELLAEILIFSCNLHQILYFLRELSLINNGDKEQQTFNKEEFYSFLEAKLKRTIE